MRRYRAALGTRLTIVGGFLLSAVIFGCQQGLPKSVKAGDVITWDPPDRRFGTLILTIPDKVCVPEPQGKHDQKQHVYVVPVTTKVTCKLLAPPSPSSEPLTYYYKYLFVQSQPNTPPSSPKTSTGGALVLENIAGSCGGCGTRTKDLSVSGSEVHREVECLGSPAAPTVVDDNGIESLDFPVPSGVGLATWTPLLDTVTIKFPNPTNPTPCTNINSGVLTGNQCIVGDKTARGKQYPYTVTLSGCNNGSPSTKQYTLTLQQ
jgi:hypothetical protein